MKTKPFTNQRQHSNLVTGHCSAPDPEPIVLEYEHENVAMPLLASHSMKQRVFQKKTGSDLQFGIKKNDVPAATQKLLLTPSEQQEFERLDRIARNGFRGIVEAGLALEEIRTKRLYRAKFSTFREYCNTFFELTPQYVGRLISAGKVREEMETFVSKNGLELELPKTEGVLRQLKRIKSAPERVQVYQQTSLASGKPPTASEVAAAVGRHLGAAPAKAKEKKTAPDASDSDRVRTALSLLDDYAEGDMPLEMLAKCLRDALEGDLE